MVGLNSVRVFGYGVMACRDLDASATGYKHVWNAVEIGGAWYLVDTSWAASPVLDGSDDPNFFFLTPPSSFVHRHLPHDSDWQLLDDPVSNGAFWGGLASCD
jgi:transglutaminase/protease-like cytokinesis protein 3